MQSWQREFVLLTSFKDNTNILFNEQLYAALHEWRTGIYQAVEFSANSYLDVYNGHINTFYHVLDERSAYFHHMMANIYSQASIVT